MAFGVIPEKDAQGRIVNTNEPFATKDNYHFRAHGIKASVAANTVTNIDFTVPYSHARFNGINILWGDDGDTANLKVIDDANGTYSTIPGYTLDQFGFNWNIETAGTKEVLPYYADVYGNMIIRVEYNNSTNEAKDIAINIYLHEEQE